MSSFFNYTNITCRYVNGTRLDDRLIRVDWDAGFIEGRQYGRGKTGGQVRDEYRTDYDAGRGGYGKLLSQKLEIGPKCWYESHIYNSIKFSYNI